MFIALLSFIGSLEIKFMSLNKEPCMNRPALIVLNPIEPNYYQFMISLDKCNGSCNYLQIYVFGVKQKTQMLKCLT